MSLKYLVCLEFMRTTLVTEAKYNDEISTLLAEVDSLRVELRKIGSAQAVRAAVALPCEEDALDQIISQQRVILTFASLIFFTVLVLFFLGLCVFVKTRNIVRFIF